MTFFDESDFSWTIFATEISKDPDLIQTLCLHEKKINIFYNIPIKIHNQDRQLLYYVQFYNFENLGVILLFEIKFHMKNLLGNKN